jgi:hypothetical protein
MSKQILALFVFIVLANSMILPHPGKPKTHAPRQYNVQMKASS